MRATAHEAEQTVTQVWSHDQGQSEQTHIYNPVLGMLEGPSALTLHGRWPRTSKDLA